MILYSSGTLLFFDSLAEQHRAKDYVYERQKAPIAVRINHAPPFQVVIPLGVANMNSVTLVKESDGVETDRYAVMAPLGFATRSFGAYKIIVWAGVASIPYVSGSGGGNLEKGTYYLKVSNGSQTIYSEEFVMADDVDDAGQFIKIEYCHAENFPLPGDYHIDYRFGYRNFLYLRTRIGKPEYISEKVVENRDGFNFREQTIRYKRSRFEILAPEEVIDIISLIGLHDTVTIYKGDKVLEVDEFEMLSPDWMERGDVAAVECEFKTDTVVVVNGKGIATGDECGPEDGDCFEVTLNAVAFILEGSGEWDDKYYVDQYGNQIPLVGGDLVVVLERPSDDIVLYEYNGSTLIPHPTTPGVPGTYIYGDYIFEANTGTYYYDNGDSSLLYSHISSVVGTHVAGQAIPISSVELWALLATGFEVLLTVVESYEFTVSGIDFTPPATPIVALKIRVSSSMCAYYYDGAWLYLDPFGLVACASSYADDVSAGVGGIEAGEFYCLSIANLYGMTEGFVKRLEPFTGFSSDIGAVASLGRNVIYQLNEDNIVGAPSGICRIAVDGIPVYASDAEAATGGVIVGDFYAYNEAGATADNYCFVKKRIS